MIALPDKDKRLIPVIPSLPLKKNYIRFRRACFALDEQRVRQKFVSRIDNPTCKNGETSELPTTFECSHEQRAVLEWYRAAVEKKTLLCYPNEPYVQ
jgi:hypothetical protein